MEPNHFDRTNFAGCPGRQFASAPRIITCPSFIQCHNCFCLLQQMNALLFYLGKAFDLLTIVLVGVVAGCFALVGLIAMLPIILPAFIAKQILRLDRDCCDWYILPLGIGAIGAALVLLVLELIWLPIYFLLVMFTFGSIISEDGEEQLALQARPVILIMTMVIVDDD